MLTAGLVFSHSSNVKAVKATGTTVDLSTLTGDYVAQNGDILTGTLGGLYKISIADKAIVTLKNAAINGVQDASCPFAGITCLGDSTIILEGDNTAVGFQSYYPGIFIPKNKTLTIKEETEAPGSLTAHSSTLTAPAIGSAGLSEYSEGGNLIVDSGTLNLSSKSRAACIGGTNGGSFGNITINGGTINGQTKNNAAVIGSGCPGTCGDITINGGNITAVVEYYGTGIGSGSEGTCGNITITGGTINATVGSNGGAAIGAGYDGGVCGDILISGGTITATAKKDCNAAIGSGYNTDEKESVCGNITITGDDTVVTATRGDNTIYSVGPGTGSSCGTVTIGGVVGYRTEKVFKYPFEHTHDWSYVASGSSITASCSNSDCPVITGLTLALQAPDNLVYDGTNKVCSLAAGYSEAAFGTPSIEYYKSNSLVSECINAGTYEARVTVGGVTAKLQFEITQATPSYVVPTGLASTYGNKLSSVTLPSGWTWKNPNDLVGNAGDRTHVAIYTPTDPNYHSVEENVTIAVAKANPTYVVPSGLCIRTNSTLSMLSLPTGFAWADPTQNVGSTAGNFTFKANYTPNDTDNYNVVNNIDIPVEVYVHEHNWSYVVNGSSILASCSNPECPVDTGLTLALVAPTNLVFDGSAKTASFEDDYNSEAFGTPSIEYYENNSLVSECVDAGVYEARVTVGGATAKVQFEITQATPTGYVVPTGLEAVYGDKLSSVALPEHWSWKNPNDLVGNAGNQNHIAIYTPEDPNYKAVEENVTISVSKANPTYVVPSTIDAPYNVELSTIGLPEGFSWMDGSQKTSTWGENAFKAKYTPSDTVNYNIVENIDIKVNVKWVLVDPTEGDVTVTINDGETEYNVDISVKVEVKTEVTVDEKRTEYASIGREFIKQDEDINAIYSVKLIRTVGGVEQEIQPSDIKEGTKIIVSMPVPEELVGKSFRLLEIFSTTEAKEMENYALSKDGKTLVVEVDRMGEFAFLSHTDVPNGFDYSTGLPGWAIALIIVGSILLLCLLCFFLLFFVFNKWIKKDDKALRAVKFGKKDNKVRLLVIPFKFEYREESQIFNSKSEALK